MAGIGFAGQAHTWNKDNLSQMDRRAGFNRRQENYDERSDVLVCKEPTEEELRLFRQAFYQRQKRERRQERILWLIFALPSVAVAVWFILWLTS